MLTALVGAERCSVRVNGVSAVIVVQSNRADVSQSVPWPHARQQTLHGADDTLTGSLDAAPHGPDVLARFPVAGRLGTTGVESTVAGYPRTAATRPRPGGCCHCG